MSFFLGPLLAIGCRGGADSTAHASAEAPRESGALLTVQDSQLLCLDDPRGDLPLDRQLREAQERARRLPDVAEEWSTTGGLWVRKARIASDSGLYANVEGCASVALSVDPLLTSALNLHGLVLMNGHRFEEARRVAEDVLTRDPDDRVAMGTLADALLELGRYDEATKAVNRLSATYPGMASDTRASYLSWLRGDLASARTHIQAALVARDPRDPEPAAWTFVEAANLYWHKGDYDGASVIYAEARKWVTDYPAALFGEGRIALAKGEAARAIELLEKSYQLRPVAETAWWLGDAHAMAGNEKAAAEAYAHVVKRGREGETLTLAQFYATKNRDIDEALRLVEEERAVRGGVHVDDTYAWVLYRAGRLAQARDASDRAMRLGTPDARILYHAGAIRIAAGDAEGGRELVERALAMNPSFDWTEAAEARQLM